MLTITEWIYGTTQFAVVILSFVAGVLALSIYKYTKNKAAVSSWNYMIVVLLLFMVVEFLGGLSTFGVYRTPHLTHTFAAVALGFLITALNRQLNITRGWVQ